ncbi:MAG: DUF58 domain-containing protein [Candidatus Hydrogenedentes bacterium]|nr:DUF58 domain-containing protein [Candidatus Hydrogenedentota bacterium]
MKKGFPDRLADLVRDLWTFKLTASGKALVGIGVVSGILGHPLQLPILYTFSALFALGFVAWVVNWLIRPRLEIIGTFPQTASVGQSTTGFFTIVNVSRRPAYDVSIGYFGLDRALESKDSEKLHRHLATGERASLPVTLQPRRRGYYSLPPLRAYTTFPFSICRSGRRSANGGSLLVIPSFHPLAGMNIVAGRRYQPGGVALTSGVGESVEYIGNREYRPGDPQGRIDFRSWARLAKPVVREYQEEFYCRIALVLDTYVTGRRRRPRAGFPELEAAVSLTASAADALSHGEYLIDLFAAGPELYVFRAGRHTAHFENILEILACIDECRIDPFAVVAPALAEELTRVSTIVGIFLDWDDSRETLVQTALEAGCAAKIVVVRDGSTSKPMDNIEALTGMPATQLSCEEVRKGAFDQL